MRDARERERARARKCNYLFRDADANQARHGNIDGDNVS